MSSYGDRETWRTIPVELQELPQWGCWRYSAEGDKHPIGLTGGTRPVNAHALANLTGFNAAVAAAVEHDCGLYFDIREEDPYVGVDLDDCLAEGVLHVAALKIVERFKGAYIEVSPSGAGIKILGRGTIPGPLGGAPAPWRGMIELYDRRRFWAMTGRRFDV
jgi:putative DNA primase/helicase